MNAKYLQYLVSLVFFIASSQIQCAESRPDFDAGAAAQYYVEGADGQAQSLIILTNATDRDLWVAVKAGGQFTSGRDTILGQKTCARVSAGTVLLVDPLIRSGQSKIFNKYGFQNFTLRVFETEDDLMHYENSKFAMRYAPIEMAGLKEITINFTDDGGYTTSKRVSFLGFECAICLARINEGDIVAVAKPCAHKMHRRCVEDWIARAGNQEVQMDRTAQCVLCNSPVTRYYYYDAATGTQIHR